MTAGQSKPLLKPEAEAWLAQHPHLPTLEAKAVEGFRRRDSEVGAQKPK